MYQLLRVSTTLDPALAETALDYLDRYHYASRDHLVFLLLWRTGIRSGALRGVDLGDLDLDDDAFQLVHRPDQDTSLKNKERGERWVALTPAIAQVVEAYIDGPRVDQTDEFGREPLVTTREGRIARGTIRDTIYRWTRPCVFGEPCPEERDPDDCEAAVNEHASKCPVSRSPHDVRSGAITAHLLDDVPTEIVSDRMNVS